MAYFRLEIAPNETVFWDHLWGSRGENGTEQRKTVPGVSLPTVAHAPQRHLAPTLTHAGDLASLVRERRGAIKSSTSVILYSCDLAGALAERARLFLVAPAAVLGYREYATDGRGKERFAAPAEAINTGVDVAQVALQDFIPSV